MPAAGSYGARRSAPLSLCADRLAASERSLCFWDRAEIRARAQVVAPLPRTRHQAAPGSRSTGDFRRGGVSAAALSPGGFGSSFGNRVEAAAPDYGAPVLGGAAGAPPARARLGATDDMPPRASRRTSRQAALAGASAGLRVEGKQIDSSQLQPSPFDRDPMRSAPAAGLPTLGARAGGGAAEPPGGAFAGEGHVPSVALPALPSQLPSHLPALNSQEFWDLASSQVRRLQGSFPRILSGPNGLPSLIPGLFNRMSGLTGCSGSSPVGAAAGGGGGGSPVSGFRASYPAAVPPPAAAAECGEAGLLGEDALGELRRRAGEPGGGAAGPAGGDAAEDAAGLGLGRHGSPGAVLGAPAAGAPGGDSADGLADQPRALANAFSDVCGQLSDVHGAAQLLHSMLQNLGSGQGLHLLGDLDMSFAALPSRPDTPVLAGANGGGHALEAAEVPAAAGPPRLGGSLGSGSGDLCLVHPKKRRLLQSVQASPVHELRS